MWAFFVDVAAGDLRLWGRLQGYSRVEWSGNKMWVKKILVPCILGAVVDEFGSTEVALLVTRNSKADEF